MIRYFKLINKKGIEITFDVDSDIVVDMLQKHYQENGIKMLEITEAEYKKDKEETPI